jgi:hypothetical protein
MFCINEFTRVEFYDWTTKALMSSFEAKNISRVVIASNSTFAFIETDTCLYKYSLTENVVTGSIHDHFYKIILSPNDEYVFSRVRLGRMWYICEIRTDDLSMRRIRDADRLSLMAAGSDSRTVYYDIDSQTYCINADTLESTPLGQWMSVAVSPVNGAIALSRHNETVVRLNGDEIRIPLAGPQRFTRDGSTLVIKTSNSVQFYDVHTGDLVQTYEDDEIMYVFTSPITDEVMLAYHDHITFLNVLTDQTEDIRFDSQESILSSSGPYTGNVLM